MPLRSISLFFPMYNESKNILQVLNQVFSTIPDLGIPDYEVMFVDDGSRDGCDKYIEQASQDNSHIRLVRHPQNMGYGAALRTGFTEATREAVFYTDCDLPIDLQDIERALPLLDEADLVIGYRIKRYETFRRAVYSRIYNLLMRVIFDVHVRDVNFSFKLVHRRVLNQIHLNAKSVFIDGQILAEARRYGYKIVEIPIVYTPRKFGKSNFDCFHAAWLTFTEMVSYWRERTFVNEAVVSLNNLGDELVSDN